MINVLIEKTEIVQEELHVDTRVDYKTLKSNIKVQRDENEILYKNLKEIAKDTESQRQKVAVFQAKIEELEQHVGIIAFNHPEEDEQKIYHVASADPAYDEEQEWNLNAESPRQQSDKNINSISPHNVVERETNSVQQLLHNKTLENDKDEPGLNIEGTPNAKKNQSVTTLAGVNADS